MKYFSLLLIALGMVGLMMTPRVRGQDDVGADVDEESLMTGEEDVDYGEVDAEALFQDEHDFEGDFWYKRPKCGRDIHWKKVFWNKYHRTSFSFFVHRKAEFTVTDLGCAGETFEIFVNGKSQGHTSGAKHDLKCKFPIFDPLTAYNKLDYSARQIVLEKGHHYIEIKPVKYSKHRPYGRIAVGVNYFDGKCCRGDDFSVIRHKIVGDQAKRGCHYYGKALARTDIKNFHDANIVAYTCLGDIAKPWVNSWNGDDYGKSCIAFHTSRHFKGGSINVPHGACKAREPILCEKFKKYPHY